MENAQNRQLSSPFFQPGPNPTVRPSNYGLYSFENEHDACGVGMIARIDNRATHGILEKGIGILKRLMHRGAAGGDPNTGDGAGLLFRLPDKFLRQQMRRQKVVLPPVGRYAVAMLFGGEGKEAELESRFVAEGLTVLGWREVPVCADAIGETARLSLPLIRQLFIGAGSIEDQDAFERKLFVARRQIEKMVSGVYVPSCSSRTIVYKGLLLATQIDRFYPDLADPAVESPFALVHQRYSTNTFPTWSLAHPFRYLAHNGEINTLHGNLNQLRSREPFLSSPLFGDDLKKVLPLIADGQSDSACLDNMLELLVLAGRSMPHAMLMLMPQAWGASYHMGRDVRGFFDYHSELMEPWDGPAAVGFSDGRNIGAMLDRNGLRPVRWSLTKDGLFTLASEAGVVDQNPADVIRNGRLRPGEMIWCDLEHGRLVRDAEIKNTIARQKPYRRWAAENKIAIHGLFDSVNAAVIPENLHRRQHLFGWTRETVDTLILPMAEKGQEGVGSMGNDAALPVLSRKPHSLFGYFKQHFAQVTNPPIDPIRERLVMSLTTYIGNRGNILAEEESKASVIRLARPILTDEDVVRLSTSHEAHAATAILPLRWEGSLERSIEGLQRRAIEEVRSGRSILILSDRTLSEKDLPIPSLLGVAAVNRALIEAGLRPPVGLIVQSGEVAEVMDYALLLGYGATAIHPYLALETVSDLAVSGRTNANAARSAENYITAVDKGLLKIMSKMGISTLRSYRSAQIFEAVGLDNSVIDRFFPGTISRIGGLTIADLEEESLARHNEALVHIDEAALPAGGEYKWRNDGKDHLWTPASLAAFRQAIERNDPAKYHEYADLINKQAGHLCTLRGLFKFAKTTPIPIEEVESVPSIIRHFVSGAMSLGSLSPEAHETIAIAMNRMGAASNCGEGGEDPNRNTPTANGQDRHSQIRQVASGRFGVTIDYLAKAQELQIKIAQGAKPGEGGQLPGIKVDEEIARVRHSTPHVTLISPPPHHDIYSIEDLAQLIFDLHNANREARISVKLVSESGVGTIAAGVAKGHADMILISGHDGGTGSSPLTSIKHAGLPWELGLAETQQTLVANRLRERVRLQVDGQLKTGRDVVIGALLGAEEFGFGTTVLVCLGCVMMRKCSGNCCPVGVATQDPVLRSFFRGKPEYIENFFRFVAEEVRETLALLGLRSLDEAVGRSDLLCMDDALAFYKTKHLDFSRIFQPAIGSDAIRWGGQLQKVETYDEKFLLPEVRPFFETLSAQIHAEKGEAKQLVLDRVLRNENRTVGTETSCLLDRTFGVAGLPKDTVTVRFSGCAGQSFGAFLAPGITFQLRGEANDFIGKGLSGGVIVVQPPKEAPFKAEENVIAGNVVGFGGTSGEIYINGQAGERFCIRNSGITAVVEGVGDHGCEYMTGGRVVVLGPTGVNFAAGMTGGIAYVYDATNDFDLNCNVESVDLEPVLAESEEEAELLRLIHEHVRRTESPLAKSMLDNWEVVRPRFIRIIPIDYRKALALQKGKANPA